MIGETPHPDLRNPGAGVRVEPVPDGAAGDALFASVRPPGQSAATEGAASGGERYVAWRGDRPSARCTLWIADDLVGVAGRSGLVGQFEAPDDDAGTALLGWARETLAARGAQQVLGPMNGSTWHRYRLALPDDEAGSSFAAPFFLGEPRNPADYPALFLAAGFEVAAHYESRVEEPARGTREDAQAAIATTEERLRRQSIRVRTVDLSRFDEELALLFELSRAAFADNPYYRPIELGEFRSLYAPLRSLLDPDFVLIAEGPDRTPLSFLLAYPDRDPVSGAPSGRLVAKSLATAPAARGLGLGSHLLARVSAQAFARDYDAMIYALIHVANVSRAITERQGGRRVLRRYALYAAPGATSDAAGSASGSSAGP